MKRILITLLCLCLAAGLSGCLPMLLANAAKSSSTVEKVESAVNTEESSEAAKVENVAPSGKQEGEGTLGNFTVKIGDAETVKDYEGNPAILITYDFTNNDEKAQSFGMSVMPKAFQDGIECKDAYLPSDVKYEDNYMVEIKPGKSITVQRAYKLDGETAVDVEVTELISFDDKSMVVKSFELK